MKLKILREITIGFIMGSLIFSYNAYSSSPDCISKEQVDDLANLHTAALYYELRTIVDVINRAPARDQPILTKNLSDLLYFLATEIERYENKSWLSEENKEKIKAVKEFKKNFTARNTTDNQ